MKSFLIIITTAAVIGTAVSSAVVPSDPAAAPSAEAGGGKNHHETSTAGSGGSTQIGTGSDDSPTGLRPTDGTTVGLPSTAITVYLPPNSVFEQLLKKEADVDVGVPKKDAEVAENSPVAASDENIVGTTVISTDKDTGMTIVTDSYCYDCIDEATTWTLGGTDVTKSDGNRKTAADLSFDGNANLVKKEDEDGTVGPIVGPVGPTSDMLVHGDTNTGPAALTKTIVTADQTLVDSTDAMAVIAGLHNTSIPISPHTPVSTAKAEVEVEVKVKVKVDGAINGTAADKSPKNGTTVTSITTNTTTTSDVTSDNNPEVDDDDDGNKKSPKARRINGEKDAIIIPPSSIVPGNAKTIVTTKQTMVDITDAMAVIAGLIELEKKPGLPDELKKATNGTTPSNPKVSTATTDTTKKRTTTTTTKKKKTRSIFFPKPTFRDDVHRFLLSIPAYLPDPFVLIVIAVESVYDFVTTNSVGDVVSKATRVVSEGITKIASGLTDAATAILGKAVTLLTKAAESITEGIGKIASGVNDAATAALGKAATLGNEVNATMMEAIDSVGEADVKKISHGLTMGAAFVFIVLTGVTFEYFLFRN